MKYFKAYELVDRGTYVRLGEKSFSIFKPDALQALDDLREFLGVPLIVNNWIAGGSFEWRGYRTQKKAIALGAPNSRHAKGDAFDLDVQGMTAEEVRQKIIANQDNPLLEKIMRLEADKSWVHFDLMPLKEGVHRIYLFKA
jgi:hypothetical protein